MRRWQATVLLAHNTKVGRRKAPDEKREVQAPDAVTAWTIAGEMKGVKRVIEVQEIKVEKEAG